MNEQHWKSDFLQTSLLFEPIRKAGFYLEKLESWPDLDDMNGSLVNNSRSMKTASGHPVRFVSQDILVGGFARQYESRIYLAGEIQTREQNWHDLFNALVWFTFPRAKAMLNQLHYHALLKELQAGETRRGPLRDAATLFDESGVVVVSSHKRLNLFLENFEWKTLFWEQRALLETHMKFLCLGMGYMRRGLIPM